MMEQMQGAKNQQNNGQEKGKGDKFDDSQLRNVDITS